MLAVLTLLPDATLLAVERASATVVRAQAVLAAKRQTVSRAREFCSGAEHRADDLQARMIGMKLVSPRRPLPAPVGGFKGAGTWRRADW